MITVSQAEEIILQNVVPFPDKKIRLKKAYGRASREDVVADRDQPPAHRVSMDGIAIIFSAWEKGQRRFQIQGTQKAGIPALTLKNISSCIEAMTGAVLPQGCDCIVPIEDVQIKDKAAELKKGITLTPMQNVHPKAMDYKTGQTLLEGGERLSPQHIAVAAAVGKAKIKVAADPEIAVIGTGDELIEINKAVADYEVHRSNEYTVEAILRTNGFQRVSRFHLPDNKKKLKNSLADLLLDFDVLILSGGISMGKFDFVPTVLKELKVALLFHKVKQRPGKPFWFGKSKKNRPVFALPGNPVSTQMCTYRYVLPYLRAASGLKKQPPEFAVLSQGFEPKKDLTYFRPARVSSHSDARLTATLVSNHGSGDYASLKGAHGFVELPAGEKSFPAGSVVKFLRW